jgi:hypothetical protein
LTSIKSVLICHHVPSRCSSHIANLYREVAALLCCSAGNVDRPWEAGSVSNDGPAEWLELVVRLHLKQFGLGQSGLGGASKCVYCNGWLLTLLA